MEKSLRKIANSISIIESFQKERLNELENQKKVQRTVDSEKDSEKPNSQQILKPNSVPGEFIKVTLDAWIFFSLMCLSIDLM